MTEEQTLAEVGANLFRGIESVGGRMRLTDRRIVFEPHRLNLQRQPVEIPLDEVVLVRKRNTWLLVPNGFLVRTREGTDYKFVVSGRARLIRLIAEHSPAAT